MRDLGTVLKLSPLRIAVIYLAVGSVWILVSDQLVKSYIETQEMQTALQSVKGEGWIIASSLLIFGLARVREEQLRDTRSRYEITSAQLQVIHRLLQHNMRNSLNVALGYIELCRMEIDRTDCQRWLDRAEDAAMDFIEMGNKLGIVDQVNPTEAIDETIDLVSVIESAVESREAEYLDLTIRTDLPDEAVVRGGQSIGYIVEEAIDNAILHNDKPPSEQELEIEAVVNDGVRLRIEDNGPGIPADELTAIQSGFETHLTHATGVGLWVMKWLTLLVGGDIAFDTAGDTGTVVEITFPTVSNIEAFVNHELSPTPTSMQTPQSA